MCNIALPFQKPGYARRITYCDSWLMTPKSLYSTNEHEPNDGTDESSLWRPENILRESKWRSSFPSHNNGEKLTDDVTGSLHCNCLLCVQIRTMSYDILKKVYLVSLTTPHLDSLIAGGLSLTRNKTY